MASDLLNRPDQDQDTVSDPDPIQNDVDQRFNDMVRPENYAQDGVEPELRKAEENPGSDPKGNLYNPKGDSDKSDSGGAAPVAALAGAEAAGAGLFNPIDAAGGGAVGAGRKLFGTFLGSRRRKQATAGGSILGLLFAGGFFIVTIASGPAQLIHLGEILSKNFSNSENTTKIRARGLFMYARTGEVGYTRLKFLGSRSYGKTIAQLKDIGIEFEANKYSGAAEKVNIDPAKLEAKIPELKGLSAEKQLGILTERFNLPKSSFSVTDGKFSIDTESSAKIVRSVNRSSISLLTDSKTISAVKVRPLDKFFNTPSLWHPLKRIKAAAENKAGRAAVLRDIEKERIKTEQANVETKAATAQAEVKGKFTGLKAGLGGALIITAAACTARDAADEIVKFNNDSIVAKTAVSALDKQALGSQLKHFTDKDTTNDSGAAAATSLIDKDGKSIWQSKPLQATAGGSTQGGEDIPAEYAQAFLPSNSANNLRNSIGLGPLGGPLCSPLGIALQGFAGLALLAAAIPTDGATAGAFFAAKAAVTTVGAIGSFYLIKTVIVDNLRNDSVVPSVLSGPLGGSLYAYGAREASSISAYSSGGVVLSQSETSYIDNRTIQESNQEFKSRSTFAKLFDTSDYRSLSAKILDKTSPSAAQNLDTMATSLISFSTLRGAVLGIISPRVNADEKPYKWVSPRVGIPQSMLNNPKYADPYANGDMVATLLSDPNSNYATRISQCFGDTVTNGDKGWQVVPSSAVNRNSSEYEAGNCNDTSENWQRVMMFLEDSRDMDAAVCFDSGDEESCTNSGIGANATTANAADPNVGGIGTAGGMTFPLKTTKATIKNNNPAWNTTALDNQHRNYNAADIFAPTGTPVVAAYNGKVVSTKNSPPNGTNLTYKTDTGLLVYYTHMGTGSVTVNAGDTVTSGQIVGAVGTREDARGTDQHLHMDELPLNIYQFRPICSNAGGSTGCEKFPFINIQPLLVGAFNALP